MIILTQRNNCSFSTNLDMSFYNSGHKGLMWSIEVNISLVNIMKTFDI